MTVRAVLQARCSSRRFPRKVLADLHGAPMIVRQLERVRRARRLDELVVATSTDGSDDPLVERVEAEGLRVHRGSLEDVLERFIDASAGADHVVRLTGDCPLASPAVIDALVERHLATGADYTSNTLERTFPIGLDAEVVTRAALLAAHAEADLGSEREHVTPFVYKRPERFRLENLRGPGEHGDLRWTVDEPADLEFVAAVYAALYDADPAFTTEDVLALLARRPELARINAGVEHSGYRRSLAEDRRVDR